MFPAIKKTLILSLGLVLLSSLEAQAKPSFKGRFLSANSDSDSGYGCWLESYGRGVGKPITTCPDGQDLDAGLCYPACQDGYTGVGPVCWQNCPGGFTDTGADCLKPGSYGRGAGYAIWDQGKCQSDNPQGCQQWGAMWYPDCAANYHPVGCCVCSPNCPSDMTDIGVSCQKQSYGRGVGTPMVCASNLDEDAALCYTKCRSGYTGDGPVCWGTCPTGMYKCGALCVETENDCVNDMFQIGNEVLNGISQYAGGEDDVIGALITVAQTGVKITEQLASYKTCTNM